MCINDTYLFSVSTTLLSSVIYYGKKVKNKNAIQLGYDA